MTQNQTPLAGTDPPPESAPDDPRTIRIIALYSTPWRSGGSRASKPPAELETDDVGASAHRPQTVAERELGAPVDKWPHSWRAGSIRRTEVRLLSVPQRRVVFALQLDVTAWLIDVVELLRHCFHLDLTLTPGPSGGDGGDLKSIATDLAQRSHVDMDDRDFGAECYLLVSARRMHVRDPASALRRLIDWAPRSDPPWPTPIRYPDELNRSARAAAVGPHVSVLCDQDTSLVDFASVIAYQAVVSMARLREIREELAGHLAGADPDGREPAGRPAAPAGLATALRDSARKLEIVAASPPGVELSKLPPGGNAFRRAVYESIGIASRAAALRRQLRRLQATVHAVPAVNETPDPPPADDPEPRLPHPSTGDGGTDEGRVAPPESEERARLGENAKSISQAVVPVSLVAAVIGLLGSPGGDLPWLPQPLELTYVGLGALGLTAAILAFLPGDRSRPATPGRMRGQNSGL